MPNEVLAPSQMVELDGPTVTTGAVFTVKVAEPEVAAGVQVPDTMQRYWYALIAAVTPVKLSVAEVTLL